MPLGYYRVKLEQEAVVARGSLEWAIMRAAQFHQLLDTWFTTAARLPALPVPRIPVRPTDAAEVAAVVADAAAAAPGAATGCCRSQVPTLDDAARQWLGARGRRGRVLSAPIPGRRWAGPRIGAQTAPDRRTGRTTFAQRLRSGSGP